MALSLTGVQVMKNNYQWKSDISNLLQSYLTEKQMTGFKFEKQERELERFDNYYFSEWL